MALIELEGISKSFKVYERPKGRLAVLRGAFTREARIINALDGISFSIDGGELVGYIGPNGAGKSTSVKVMSGILTPDAGECRVLGLVPWKNRVEYVAQIGVVFGQRSQLGWDVPISDSFNFMREIYEIEKNDYQKRLNELCETLNIGEFLKTPTRQLSLGQRMRCEIVAALLHRPKILFLDEPTIGLDAVSKLALRKFLKMENREHGTSMILTTHDMDDIEALCDHVMVIGHGKLLFDGAISEMKNQFSPLRCVRVKADSFPADFHLDIAEKIEIFDGERIIWFNPSHVPPNEFIARLTSCIHFNDIFIEEQNIDQIVADMYARLDL